ncbi:peptidase M50 [Litorisediminicola beolgyonensis]|uniref:Peptidase M50 n=1 Tax=Litorisediminicola beolgyonensis TaxID=1173614 RepID=A0ABW3ZDE8_9RHOB
MSGQSFYSQDWHRVAGLKLRLRSNAGVSRQSFRGDLWYVLQDRGSGKFHRFSPEAWLVISLLDGSRTVAEAWEIACERLGDDVLTQSETIRLLSQLHGADVLRGDVMPDVAEMLDKAAKQNRKKLAMTLINPLALRLPVFDPNEFLNATFPLVRPLISWVGAVLFAGLVAYALVLFGIHWEALTGNLTDRLLAAESLILLAVTYPFVKSLHELGHGYAVKRWGGEVHEMGVMFLVFMPVPYVDASAASQFPSKHQRALVGAAGILVELTLAALAMIVWVHAEEGLVRAFAFNVMLIGGISTLVFNGNPLLRFDGYYVMADLIEIPNLGPRANKFIGYLIQKHAFGVETAQSPVTARGEAKWLFFYAIGSFVYRLFIIGAIVLFVATAFPLIGAMLAIWSVFMMFGVPLGKHGWFLLTAPALRRKRGRAFAVTGATVAALVAAVTLIPLPYATLADGVVWPAREAAVHAGASGHVVRVSAEPNARVAPDTVLLALEDPMLDASLASAEAAARRLSYRLDAVAIEDPVEARVLRERVVRAEDDLAHVRGIQERLEIRSPGAGTFILPEGEDLVGRYFNQGDLVGYVADFSDPVLIVAVPEAAADLVRSDAASVEFRFADDTGTVWPARIRREVPQITDRLPAAALSTLGGGAFVTDPGSEGLTSLGKLLQLELEFDAPAEVRGFGARVHVLFRHRDTAIAQRAWRSLRQLFLKEFDV